MEEGKFPRHLIRKIENLNFPLVALQSVRDLRRYLDRIEVHAIRRARELGAGAEDIADALGITRQGAYYKLKQINSEAKPGNDDLSVTLPEAETTRDTSR